MATDIKALEKLIEIKNLISIFRNIEENGLRNILTNVHFKKFALSEKIIHEGDTDKVIYFLLKGKCKITINNHTITTIDAGTLFGEISTIQNQPRIATVKVVEDGTTVIGFELNSDENVDYKALYIFYKNISSQLSNKVEKINRTLLAVGVE